MAVAPRAPRNDSSLNTGLSSAVDRRRLEKQGEQYNERQARKSAERAALGSLTDRGKIIADWIAKERANLNDVEKMVIATDFEALMKQYPVTKALHLDNKDLMMAQMIARLMHLDFLKDLEKRVNNIMREPKVVDAS